MYVAMPDSMNNIGHMAFLDCKSLTKIEIPDGVKIIMFGVFTGCNQLKNITLPRSVTTIYKSAFLGCTALKDVIYYGTKEQWKNIQCGAYNEALLSAKLVCKNHKKKNKILCGKLKIFHTKRKDK